MNLTFKEVRRETEEVSTFIFTPDAPVSYLAGQHLSMLLPIDQPDERGKVRTFTVSSSPTEEGIISITTKAGPSSFKKTLFGLSIGSTVEARGPSGTFILPDDQTKPLVFIAGGIGITPFRSMLRFIADRGIPQPVTLLYSNKTTQDIVFRKEIDEIAQSHSNIHLVYTLTQPKENSETWAGIVGRIDEALIRKYVQDLQQSHFYIAGPIALVEAMIAVLISIKISPEKIRFEKFSGY